MEREAINKIAKELNATIRATMSIKEVLATLDTMPEVLMTMDILLRRKLVDKYAPAFYEYIQKERDMLEASIDVLRDGLKSAPKLPAMQGGAVVEKSINEVWNDFKEQQSIKTFIEDNMCNADELAKKRLEIQLSCVTASLEALDSFLTNSMIVMATKNDE